MKIYQTMTPKEILKWILDNTGNCDWIPNECCEICPVKPYCKPNHSNEDTLEMINEHLFNKGEYHHLKV